MKFSNWLNVAELASGKSPYHTWLHVTLSASKTPSLPNPVEVMVRAPFSRRCSRDAVNNLPDPGNYPSCSFIPSILGLTAEPQLNLQGEAPGFVSAGISKHRRLDQMYLLRASNSCVD